MTQTILIGDVATIQTGPFGSQLHRKDYVENGIPIITVEHLGQDRINRNNLPRITSSDKQRLNRYWLKEGDTVFSRVGSVDRASYVHREEDGWLFSGRCLRVSPDPSKVNPRFLSFVLRSKLFTDYIKSIAVGATMPSINTKLLATAPIFLPSMDQQNYASEILDHIEVKIELNRKMNETLEMIGQTLFRHYFIDNPDAETWADGKLKDIVDNIKKPLKPGKQLAGRIYLPVDRLQMKSLSILSPQDYTDAKSSLIGFETNDILVGAMRVYFHRVNLAPAQGVTRTTAFVLRSKQFYLQAFATMLINQDMSIVYANTHSKGTTMPYAIWENGLGEMGIKIPPIDILEEFQNKVWPMLEVVRDSYQQIQTLTTLRDNLLPRLINGKVKI